MDSFFVSECKHDGGWLKLKTTDPAAFRFAHGFKAGAYTLAPMKKKRSNDANAYCWTLCDQIADRIQSTKEQVYRDAIKDVGSFQTVSVLSEAADRFAAIWEAQGLGWPAVKMNEYDGRTYIMVYNGSSVYDVHEMSRLIDYLIQEAQNIGIETLSEREKSLLLEDWHAKHSSV